MDKHNNFQKFDLASINCVEPIDDHQAETLSAGSFAITSRNYDIAETASGRPGDASLTLNFDANTPSLKFVNTSPKRGKRREGNFFMAEFRKPGQESGGIVTFYNHTDRIRREVFKEQAANGFSEVKISQLNFEEQAEIREAFPGF